MIAGPSNRSRLLGRKRIADELGVCRNTVARIIREDKSFPVFFTISHGVNVIAREDFERWLEQKRLAHQAQQLGVRTDDQV